MAQFHVGSSLASKNMLEAAKRCSLAHPRLAKWTGSSPVMYRNKLWGDIFYIFRSNIFGVHSSRYGQNFLKKADRFLVSPETVASYRRGWW